MTMRIGLGLGLERLGLIALAWPRISGAIILTISLGLVFCLPGLRFQGDIISLADRDSEIWSDYEDLRDDFALFMPHIYILVEPPDEEAAMQDWLRTQNRMVLNLRLTAGVADVQSLFALRRAAGTGGTRPLLDLEQFPDSVDALRALVAERPDAALFINPQGPRSRIAIVLDQDRTEVTAVTDAMVEQVTGLVRESGLSVQIGGASVGQREISVTLMRDMVRMIALSVIVGWSVGFLVFSDFRAVVIANLISPIAMIWTAGFAALSGQALNSITVVLPILASIIAFADAVHFIVPLSKKLQDGEPPRPAIASVLRTVGPATALTSMTTALAFGSLGLAGGGMVGVAWLGVAAVILAWIAVITLGPLLCLVIARNGLGATRFDSTRSRARFRRLAERTLSSGPLIVTGAVFASVALSLTAIQFPSEHRPSDYLPHASEARAAEVELERYFSGSVATLITMPLANTSGPLDPENRARLMIWQSALEDTLEGAVVWSRARLPEDLFVNLPEDMPDLSRDLERMLLVVSHGWQETGTQTLVRTAQLRTVLATLPGGNEARVSGATTVIATTALGDIERLRNGLFLSVVLAAGLVAFLSRSLAAGVAVGLSVLLSTLIVLVGSAAWFGSVNYGLIVALIISVGIAIDDGIHLVNVAQVSDGKGAIPDTAWIDAVARTGGAILVTSLILMATLVVTQVSSMPALRSIGREAILALAAALILTLTVIAPTAVLVERLQGRLFPRKEPQ